MKQRKLYIKSAMITFIANPFPSKKDVSTPSEHLKWWQCWIHGENIFLKHPDSSYRKINLVVLKEQFKSLLGAAETFRGSWGQNYFHTNTTTLFTIFALIFSQVYRRFITLCYVILQQIDCKSWYDNSVEFY